MKTRIVLVVFLVIIIALPVSMLLLTSNQDGASSTSSDSSPTPLPSSSASTPNSAANAKMNMEINQSDFVTASQVILKTSLGDIRLDLFKDKAPKTVQNFVTLGKVGYYEGIIFHRVIAGFMIQGGDPTGTGTSGKSIYGATFNDEINDEKIVKGSLAMANRGKGTNSNTSQFFIVSDTAQPRLDGVHTNFGKVADEASRAVVKKISNVRTDASDRPVTAVVITGFEIVK